MGPRGGPGSGLLTGMGADSSPVPTSDSNMLEKQAAKGESVSEVL